MHRDSSAPTAEHLPVPLLTEGQVARQLAISVSSLRRWRVLGTGPRFVRVGGFLVRYRQSDLNDWLNSGAPSSGPEAR